MEKDFQSAPKRFWQTIRRLRRGKRGSIQAVYILVLFILTLKRQRKGQRMAEDEEDMRDNVIKYNIEGGGEQDTQAYVRPEEPLRLTRGQGP
ncbi:hypothetical protein NHX12_017048 [Muraenolepis orangiensis]|uniref:Uncharacterized protein n=1 Tax=Muraenolepis orangiensis TaxID=630683 RepID=A0A9Q0I024_9TELE|nr:hypothetical protein NHX12_017048 [Muraenolepis orangiensis]